ncbi:complex III assembly factor LYRM7 [Phymastichus coffea]|uniref:complex III assembly factor LYRM7 n=1 Tax=Phymastichus coffea TaxID=108790 RepID=UPI00273CAD28|nr:complex III assembly factor LYRM7 [Phymastichus coffea]
METIHMIKNMPGNLRREALRAFKKLHKTRLRTFQGDEYALQVTRQRINDEFRKNKNVADESAVQELIKLAIDVEHEIKTTVVQAVEIEPGKFEVRITPDTVKLNNIPFGQPVDKSQFRPVPKCSDPSVK